MMLRSLRYIYREWFWMKYIEKHNNVQLYTMLIRNSPCENNNKKLGPQPLLISYCSTTTLAAIQSVTQPQTQQ